MLDFLCDELGEFEMSWDEDVVRRESVLEGVLLCTVIYFAPLFPPFQTRAYRNVKNVHFSL